MTQKALSSKKIVLAYDLGGTKILVGVVNEKGEVLEQIKEPARFAEGKDAVLDQLRRLGRNFLKKYPRIKNVGVASAGPLDPIHGTLLDPVNFVDADGKTWGKVALAKLLGRWLDRPVFLENDAAAAMLAEKWVGAAKKYDNAMILTLGTGLGTSAICNGELVRAGRYLHTEAGHLILRAGDESALCGCGNFGCAEGFLSGNAFARRYIGKYIRHLSARPNTSPNAEVEFTAKKIAEMARQGHPDAKAAFEEYAFLLANAIRSYIVIYSPEILVFTGSFAQASDLFLERAREHLEKLMVRRRVGTDLMPKLGLSALKNEAGLLGGAYVALHRSKK